MAGENQGVVRPGLPSVLQFLRTLARPAAGRDATDGQLLRRYTADRDEAAFGLLVARHGPLVWGVCRRVLPQAQDAEDAFQATFLVLARRAGSIGRPHLLASWLHGVASRTALKARGRAARRRRAERPLQDVGRPDPPSPIDWADLRPVLDAEVGRLPEKYRAPVVLCYLQGRTNEEAARVLGCPPGTVMSRLAWARARLRARLARRGLALPAGLAAAALAEAAAPAAAPPALAEVTIKKALLGAAGGPIAPAVATLAEGVGTTMLRTKLMILALLVAAGLVAGRAGALTWGLRAQDAQDPPPRAPAAPPAAGGKAAVTLETVPPVVVRTVPPAGAADVDPALTEIRVVFSKEMRDGSWSWSTFGPDNFPKVAGKPRYLADKRTCVLPVTLAPGTTYALWLNSETFRNFQDADGRPAVPYLLVFKTKQ